MRILGTLVTGLLVGGVARFIMPGKTPGGTLVTMGLGLGGALIATLAGRLLHWYEPGERAGWIASVVGALLVLWIYRAYVTRRAHSL